MISSYAYTFIVNPNAGRGKAGGTIPWLRNKLDLLGISYELLLTSRQGHGTELAKHALGDTVVAVGGDGTINEVLNGLDLSQKVFAIIPSGSGNDLIKSLRIPDTVPEAFQVLIGGESRKIDLGTISYDSYGTNTIHPSSRKFINGVGIGFDAAVAEQTTHVKYAQGFGVYLIAVFKMLKKYRAPTFAMQVDNTQISAKCLLIAVGNGRCVGGGFFLTPDAIIDDGKLDVCIIEDKSVYGILKVMPRVMKGRHGISDGAQFYRAESLRVQSQEAFYVHADGEILDGRPLSDVQITIERERVRVICPQ